MFSPALYLLSPGVNAAQGQKLCIQGTVGGNISMD
jgi:hypothetical protein